jgi:Domain of unknown function (DUF4262)
MQDEKDHSCINKEDLLEETKLNIEKFGLQVILVTSSGYLPSFGYSVGLWETYQHPEIICFGLPTTLTHAIINDVAEIIKNRERIQVNKPYTDIFKNSRAEFITVAPDNIEDYFNTAIIHFDTNDFPAIQLVWTDRNDKFPWEEDFEEEFIYDQPLLDRNSEFKFREPLNLTTYTTRQWLEEQKPILSVVHDEDGDWQFLTNDQLPEDIKIVALEQLILRDKTLNQVFDLEYGERAEREYIGGEWIRSQVEYSEEE